MGFRLLVRDDGSRVRLDRLPELPVPWRNCFRLTGRSVFWRRSTNCIFRGSAPYLMFCDQDDVWFKSKVELTLRKMQDADGCMEPILRFWCLPI